MGGRRAYRQPLRGRIAYRNSSKIQNQPRSEEELVWVTVKKSALHPPFRTSGLPPAPSTEPTPDAAREPKAISEILLRNTHKEIGQTQQQRSCQILRWMQIQSKTITSGDTNSTMKFMRRRSSVQRRRSSIQSSGGATADEFPQEIFYDNKTHAIPPYLAMTGEPVSALESNDDGDYHNQNNLGGGSKHSVLQRVSSFNIMSRVSSHLPQVASNLSITETSKRGLLHSSSSLSIHQQTQNNNHNDTVPRTEGDEGWDPDARASAEPEERIQPSWRLRDRMKTVGVGLIMALNVGTDPPDMIKPHPCAKLQCWMDPSSVTRQKAKEKIGERLEAQYARWQQQRAARSIKYRRALDPTVEDVRALCLWLRRQARHERILLHYNGHGVPRPTSNGEIWVFDRNHTEYIPLSVADLRQWAGKPSIVVLDCSSAAILIPTLTAPMQESPTSSPQQTSMPNDTSGNTDFEAAASHWVKDTIVLCATSEGEWLPMHPDYPADIFTACLTTPIQLALRWFVRRNRHSMGSLNPDAVDAIPGQANDRKTPLGELNWIFTAVTDTIAWNVLPKPLFQRLFRQDLLVASMFRNFFLADRVLRSLNCTPQSYPPLPPGVADHPLWQAWDLACETCLFGLLKDGIIGNHVLSSTVKAPKEANSSGETRGTPDPASTTPSASPRVQQTNNTQIPPMPSSPRRGAKVPVPSSSISSPFFSEQLTAFEIWLEYAEHHQASVEDLEYPEQLPIVLQVLLSQVHRIRALQLLRRFLELGPWAVNLSLSLGIFPYVMKLLQSPEYKTFLMGIWTSILKFDPSCQVDLIKDGALPHFIQPLATTGNPGTNQQDLVQQRTLAAFSLAASCHKYPQGQTECMRQNLHGRCAALLVTFSKLEKQYQDQVEIYKQQVAQSRGPVLLPGPEPVHQSLLSATARTWLCLCLGNMVQKCPPVQREAFNSNIHTILVDRLSDNDPEVRAAALYSLGCLLEYMPDIPPPAVPPTMSLGPGLQGLPPPAFQPGPQALGAQSLRGNTAIPVASPLTASAVLAGRVQPGMVPPNLMTQPGRPGFSHPQMQAATIRNGSVPQPGAQVPIGQLMPPGRGPPQLQPIQPMLQPQGMMMQPQPGQLQPMQPMQPMPPMQSLNQMQQMQQMQQLQQRMHTMPQMQFNGRPQMVTNGDPRLQFKQQQPGPGLRLPGTGIQNGPQIYQQQNILQPQPGSSGAGPQTSLGQSLMMAPMTPDGHSLPPHLRRRPTVFEDHRRLDLDLSLVDPVIKALSDGSFIVRYEAMMALSSLVEKYVGAFLVAADSTTSRDEDVGLPSGSSHSSLDSSKVESTHSKPTTVPMPTGLSDAAMSKFKSCWKSILKVRTSEVHPAIRKVAGSVASVIHEKLLDARADTEMEHGKKEKDKSLSGIAEEDPIGERQVDGSGRPAPRSDGPQHRIPRGQLQHSTSQDGSRRDESRTGIGALLSPPNMHHSLGNPDTAQAGSKAKYNLPKSIFYSWKRETFDSKMEDVDEEETDDRDPLNPLGAARVYQQRRNNLAREMSEDLAEHFSDLRPKPPQKKKEFDILLDESDDEADDKVSVLRLDVKLKESKKLTNTGMRMTSMLKFHPYEDTLMVCDDKDGLSVWNYEQGLQGLSFRNGNPSDSRMTSSFWINEQSKSLFFVGCDDGSARVWKGIVDDTGTTTSEKPTVAASFIALNDLNAGQRSSGLVCEWQQYNGSLIAGGNSSCLNSWDLAMEKCVATFDTGTDAEVTALTTAWDENLGKVSAHSSGMGPDVVVSGHSDGSLKIFDIRSPGGVGNIGGRPRKYTKFVEHRSWIVDVAFTSHGGRYELLSGSMGGDIRAWDLRMSKSLRTLEAQRSPMTALTVHRLIPIAATGSHTQFIKILSLGGEVLQVAKVQDRTTSRVAPVSCLEFHKLRPVLAVGCTTSTVSIFKTRYNQGN